MRKKEAQRPGHETGRTIKRIVKKHKDFNLNDRYLKVKELGKGAFGVVYSAFDQETSKTVAIKCLIDNGAIEDFQEELMLLKRLKHPSIVPYLDSFIDSKKALRIVMEYAENGSLLDIIKTYGPLNEMITTIYLSEVLEGLEYLHNQSIIHRDIKAANILMQGDRAKLADFGLAIDLDKYGHTLREAAGSPYWMAPEVINGDPTDTKCDIWSIGATTIELLTGKPPFWDLPPMPAMFQIAGPRNIPIPQQFSPQCKEFLSLCLNKNPKLRPDARQLLEHPWLEKARNLRKSLSQTQTKNEKGKGKGKEKPKYDVGSLTLRLGGDQFWDDDSVINKIAPETMCTMFNDDNTFEKGAIEIMRNIDSIKRLPELIQGICGARNIIDKLDNPKFRRQTLNFIQCISPYSNSVATTLLLHSIPQALLFDIEKREDIDVIHQQITALSLLFGSQTGAKFCCYSGLVNKLDQLMSIPLLSVFVPHIILMILEAKLPANVSSILIAKKALISKYVKLAFKAALHYNKYQSMITDKFESMSSLLKSNDDDKICKHLISDNLLNISKNMLDDSLAILLRLSSLSPQSQYYLAEEFDPICYIINNVEKFPALSQKNFTTILHIFNNVSFNLVAREKIKCESVLSSLINRITGSYDDDSACVLQIVSNMIKHVPELIECACDRGLCNALEKSRNLVESTVRIRDLLCEIPTISPFCAWKLKETNLYEILIELLELPIWNRKAIHALSCWTRFDSRYIAKHLLKNAKFIQDFLVSELRSTTIRPDSFIDLSIMMQYCTEVGHLLYSDEILNGVMKCLSRVGPYGQIQFFEFLIQLILQSPRPDKIAASLLQEMIPYTQSPVLQVQKAALRIRVLSRC